MENDSKIIEQLPYVILTQWKAAQREDTPAEWAYVAGMIGGEISRNPCPELMTAHNIAMQSATTAASRATTGKFSLLNPQQRLDALSDALIRMKSHSVILSQFFARPATKQAALEGMEAELANLQTLWALVRADLSEVQQ
ncbi:hypothetical protein RCF98_02575 [Thiothrix lacustris]|uniref:Uncharacterized protein n=1 Tax=Thiothrix lacustris TaxID=525917 RepID=A0ABY9MRT3_9GAMM|nr:hypothetical protein [Thiothrix lacustris]WML91248.1 hypothetical protein RCF98_02575 [Thiothrix lacustris]